MQLLPSEPFVIKLYCRCLISLASVTMKSNSFKCHSDFILLVLLKLHYFYKPVRIDEDRAVAGMNSVGLSFTAL